MSSVLVGNNIATQSNKYVSRPRISRRICIFPLIHTYISVHLNLRNMKIALKARKAVIFIGNFQFLVP